MGVPKKRGNVFESITLGYLALLLTVFLFYTGTEGFQNIQASKFGAFRLLCGGYVVLMAVCGVESVLVGARKFPHPRALWKKSSWTQRFAVFYPLITWVSAFCSPYFPETVWGVSRHEGAMTISLYCACFLLVSVFGKADLRLLWIFAASATLFGLLCAAQLLGMNPFGLYPEGYTYFDAYTAYSGAYLGTLGNVDLAAAFLCLAVPVLWVSLCRLQSAWKWALLLPLALLLFVLVKSSVLAGLVGVGVGAALSLPLAFPWGKKARRRCWLALLALGLGAVALLFFVDFGSGLFHELHQLLHGRPDDAFGSGRLYIWKNVLRRLSLHPLLGTGPDTMLYWKIDPFTRYDPRLGGNIVSQIDIAHNEYLNVLGQQGLLAFLAYLGLLVCGLGKWFRDRGKNPKAAVLGSAALAYCIQAFFGFSVCITAPFFWAALALLEKETRNDQIEIKQEEKEVCGKNLSV